MMETSRTRRIWTRVLRFHLWFFGGLFVLVVALTIAGVLAKHRLAAKNPPPGRLVDVGGYRLHLHCTGEGAPAVILESGMNEFSLSWALVQPGVARFTRVCSYDRAGLGWSDPGRAPRTSETIVRELHALLRSAGIRGPLVIAGHSFGGMNARLYARRHPDEVAGMVLVDSAHEDQSLVDDGRHFRKFHEKLLSILRSASFINKTGVFALAPGLIPDRGLPAEVLPSYRAVLATTGYFTAALDETSGWDQSAAEVRAAKITSFGSLPLVVMSRGQEQQLPGVSDQELRELEKGWLMLQSRMLSLSKRSRLITADKSDHFIQLRQPELVVAAIRDVWAQAKNR